MEKKEKRPQLNIPLNQTDKILEALAFISLALLWIYTIINYIQLPDKIPTHFNVKGVVDGFGRKTTLWFLPVVATIMVVGLTFLSRIPHQFNYLVKITPDNAFQQYSNAVKMMRYLKLAIVGIFFFIIYSVVKNAQSEMSGLSTWFLPIVICSTSIPAIVLIISSFKKK
jgi:uncharacterized membrane protein